MLTPRPYQEEGIEFLKSKKRAMLTDQPGLGKTLQAAIAADPPVLIAAPTYLVEQWYEFLVSQYPNLEIIMVDGVRANREAKLSIPADWYVINIEMFRSYKLPKVKTLIIDESHHVKNRKAKQTRAAYLLAKGTPNVYLLTATPITKTPDDLFAQLAIIDPAHFRSYNDFVYSYCKVGGSPWGLQILGVKDPIALRKLLMKYALGRSYKEVGLQLPDLITQRVPIVVPPYISKLYKEVAEQYRLQDIPLTSAGEVLRTLRMITVCKEKIDTTVNIVEDSGQPALVYCWYQETALQLSKALKAVLITGVMDATERRIAALNAPGNVVATLASLSEGVDLSKFRQIIFFETDYTPGMKYQALSRVRRYSADMDPIREYHIYMKGTIDEVILRCLDRRISDVRAILKEALK